MSLCTTLKSTDADNRTLLPRATKGRYEDTAETLSELLIKAVKHPPCWLQNVDTLARSWNALRTAWANWLNPDSARTDPPSQLVLPCTSEKWHEGVVKRILENLGLILQLVGGDRSTNLFLVGPCDLRVLPKSSRCLDTHDKSSHRTNPLAYSITIAPLNFALNSPSPVLHLPSLRVSSLHLSYPTINPGVSSHLQESHNLVLTQLLFCSVLGSFIFSFVFLLLSTRYTRVLISLHPTLHENGLHMSRVGGFFHAIPVSAHRVLI